VLAPLIARSDAAPLDARVSQALTHISGTYGLAVVHADCPDRIVVARNGSPLLIGVGEKEMLVASDLAALIRHTTTVAYLEDGEIATLTAAGFSTYRADLTSIHRPATEVDVDPDSYDAGEHDSFMHKEVLRAAGGRRARPARRPGRPLGHRPPRWSPDGCA